MPLPNPTVVFQTFWEFASKRCQVYEQRLTGAPQPWTNDPILQHFKFTNVFRACDRVSQYLIKVIYEPTASQHPEEVVFRILLFKLFNSILAWEILKAKFDMPTWKGFNQQAYAAVLGNAKAQGANIWNMAYVQNQNYATHLPTKHQRYLALLDHMMSTGVTAKLQAARTYQDAYQVLRTYPIHGEFIAMQHLTDLNYSEVINFDEDDFIVAGPGALDGIQKCFGVRPNQRDAAAIITDCVNDQDQFFQLVNAQPVKLNGKRRLHAIDVQNLFCETDKYARVAHPQYNLGRTSIKQTLKPAGPLPSPEFPPKWNL